MPLDGTGYRPERPERRRPAPSDNFVTFLICSVAFALIVVPVSLPALVDLIRYMQH